MSQTKVALVTGGATGIGRASVEQLAASGLDVLIHYSRSKEDAETAAAAVRERGRNADLIQADFKDRASVERVAREAEARWGRVDVLVNNAAMIEAPIDAVEGGDFGAHLDKWDDVVNVNLRAPFELTWRLAQGMMARGSGSVVNVASVAGMYALTDAPLYSLTKSGLLHFTRQAALRYAPKVRVNAVAPGWTQTGFNHGAILDPGFQKAITRHIPVKRLATADEIARAIVTLATGLDYVTGATLVVDGGLVTELR